MEPFVRKKTRRPQPKTMWDKYNPYAPPKAPPAPKWRTILVHSKEPALLTWKMYLLILTTGIFLGLEIAALILIHFERIGAIVVK